ncbi:MAG: hypothetical protein AAGK74_00420 [Chloroflexota bacterium]
MTEKAQHNQSVAKTGHAEANGAARSDEVPFEMLQRAIATPDKTTLTPRVVRQLQRTHGNQFVSGLVQRMQSQPPVIQRRVPEQAEGEAAIDSSNPEAAENIEGMRRVMIQTLEDMSAVEISTLEFALGKAPMDIAKAGTDDEVRKLFQTMHRQGKVQDFLGGSSLDAIYPGMDKAFVTPADAAERAKLEKGVDKAWYFMMAIGLGFHDEHLKNVFGEDPTNGYAKARTNFRQAAIWLNILFKKDKIGADMSGENTEMGYDGSTAAKESILLEAGAMDDPESDESQMLTMHEAFHAGNPAIDDNGGYIGAAGFESRQPSEKITNAAHYEEVCLRVMGKSTYVNDKSIIKFIPEALGKGGKGVKLDNFQKAAKAAEKVMTDAWLSGTNGFESIKATARAQKDDPRWYPDLQADWLKPALWASVVMRMTFHKRHAKDNKAKVNQIDLMQAEGVSKRLSQFGRYVEASSPKDASGLPKGVDAGKVDQIRDHILLQSMEAVGKDPIHADRATDLKMLYYLANVPNIMSVMDKPPADL